MTSSAHPVPAFAKLTPGPAMLVDSAWLETHLDDPWLRIVDCTTLIAAGSQVPANTTPALDTYRQTHIPGALFADVRQQLSDPAHETAFMLPTATQLTQTLAGWGLDPEHGWLVLYSSDEPWWATRVWWVLRAYGFHRVAVLDGGLQKWLAEGRRVLSGEPPATLATVNTPAAGYGLALQSEEIASAVDVQQALSDETQCVLSARLVSHFRGEAGNTYSRPGRIPGKANLPARSLINPIDNSYLKDEAVAALVEPLQLDDKTVIAYCGYGIAASAVVFALARLGYTQLKLYDGSLAEWSRDARLPMDVG